MRFYGWGSCLIIEKKCILHCLFIEGESNTNNYGWCKYNNKLFKKEQFYQCLRPQWAHSSSLRASLFILFFYLGSSYLALAFVQNERRQERLSDGS